MFRLDCEVYRRVDTYLDYMEIRELTHARTKFKNLSADLILFVF